MPRRTAVRMIKKEEDDSTKRRRTEAASIPNRAVFRIQRMWRLNYCPTKFCASSYLELVTKEYVAQISFQALVVFLREKSIIAVTQRCFRRLYMICVYRHGTPPLALMPKHVNVRVILCAYMIAHCPSEVFESIGATEKALIDSAIAFVDNFQSLAKKAVEVGAVSLIPIDFTRNLPTLIFEYLKCYKAWKIPDAAKLKCRIKHALVALLQAQRHLPFNEPHESKLSVELRTQIERLRSKLQLVAGVEALNEFDETCRINRMSDPPAVQAYVSVPTRMSNEQLTHEVLLDPAFQIDNRGNVDIEGQLYHEIIDYFMQAFWDSLVDDLLLPFPCYTRVLRVLVEIRDGIKGIAGGCESIAICEAIDISFIEQQLRLNAFGWDCCQRLVGTVVGIIQKVQLPSRDAETKALWATQQESMVCAEVDQPRVLCQAIRFLMDLLNNLRIDSANARIRRLSLVVKDHGIDNERRLFQVKLDSGAIVLTNTKEWICNAVRFEIAAGEDLASGSPQSFIAVHIAAMISIVTNPTPIQSETIPETLLLDMNRIRGMQNKFQSIVDGATAFVTATHSLSDKSIEKKQVLVSLGGFIASNETFDLGLVLVELGQKLDSAGILTDQAARARLFNDLAKNVNKDDAVRKLIASRISRVLSDQIHKTTRVADAQFLIAVGPLVPLVSALALKLSVLSDLNRAVHTPTYNRLIFECVD